MNRRRRVTSSTDSGFAPRWLITYSDMVTLLLCLFVLLFATGRATPREVQLILSAFRDSLGFFSGGQTLSEGALEEAGLNLENLPSQTSGRFLSRARKLAQSLFVPEVAAKRVRITEDERGVVISLIGADYFLPGSARPTPAVERILEKTSGLAEQLDRYMRVEGHAAVGEESYIAERPDLLRGERRYSNSWDLSAARAVACMNYMQGRGVPPANMQAVAYGAYRPLDIVAPDTPEAAAHNRRIDIVFLTHKSPSRRPAEPASGLPESRLPLSEYLLEDRREQ